MQDIRDQKMMTRNQTVNLLPVMVRFQKAVLEKIKGETGKVTMPSQQQYNAFFFQEIQLFLLLSLICGVHNYY